MVQHNRQSDWTIERAAITPEDVSMIRGDLERLICTAEDPGESAERVRLLVYREPQPVGFARSRIARIERFIEHSIAFHKTSLFARLQALASDWLGEDAQLFKDKINFRWPNSAGFAPHQDVAAGWLKYISCVVSIGVFPEGASASSGGMICAQADANVELLPNVKGRMFGEEFQRMNPHPVEIEPRDLLLLGGLAPHGSMHNLSEHCHHHVFLTFAPARDGEQRNNYYSDKIQAFSSSRMSKDLQFRLFDYG